MYILSGRFDAVEDSLLTPNLPSAARRVYSRTAQYINVIIVLLEYYNNFEK